MFLLYVLGVFAISLFGSQCQPQTRETLLTCNSWGDPHIQTWHPKNGDKIQQRDCYAVGLQSLIENDIVTLKVQVHTNKYASKAHLIIRNKNDKHHKLLDLTFSASDIPAAVDSLRQQGVEMTVTTVGTTTTTNVAYAAVNFLTTFRASNGLFSSVTSFMTQEMIDQSTGACFLTDIACAQRGVVTEQRDSTKQLITKEQAEHICNAHIDAYFAQIHRAPHQRDEHVNILVTNVLAGCIDDVVLTGEIEAAQAAIDVLMMDELTRHATTITEIQAAVQAGVEGASVLLDNAAKVANVRVRRFI